MFPQTPKVKPVAQRQPAQEDEEGEDESEGEGEKLDLMLVDSAPVDVVGQLWSFS